MVWHMDELGISRFEHELEEGRWCAVRSSAEVRARLEYHKTEVIKTRDNFVADMHRTMVICLKWVLGGGGGEKR